ADTSRAREQQLMHDLAEEKVVNIESRIINNDAKLFESHLSIEALIANLEELSGSLPVSSVFVLDDKRNVMLGGYAGTRTGKQAIEFRDWFERVVKPTLPLDKLGTDRGHVYRAWGERGQGNTAWDGTARLFSLKRMVSGDKIYYIVIEEDLNNLV